mgnify:CR=1 FL=1
MAVPLHARGEVRRELMTNIDRETRCRKIVKELAKLDRFLEEGSIKQTGWVLNMEYSLFGSLGLIQKSKALTVPKELHIKFYDTLTAYRADLLHELVELNKEATHDI